MYYATFVYLLVLVFIGKNYSRKARFALAAFPLVLVAFLRYGVGADYFSYEYFFSCISNSSLKNLSSTVTNIEPLFKFIMFLFAKIGINYHIFLFISSSFLIYFSLKLIEELSPNFELSVLLHYSMLYFYWNLSALRQGIVLCVLMYVYFSPTKNYSIKKKAFFTAILSFIHITALIIPVIYVISNLKWNKKWLIVLLLLAPFSRLLFRPELLGFIANVPFLNKIATYIDYKSISFLSIPSLMRLSFIVLILLSYNKLVKKDKKDKLIIDFALIGLIGYFYIPLAMVVGTRTTIFSYSLLVIILPMIVELYDSSKYIIAAYSSVILISVVSFYNEFSKLAARTGYLRNMHSLNTVTIFNGDSNDFDMQHIFYNEVFLHNKQFVENSDLSERIETNFVRIERFYKPDNEHFFVKFASNNKYGAINQDGEVVFLPYYSEPFNIYKNYIRVREEFAKNDFYYFLKIPKDNEEANNKHDRFYYGEMNDSKLIDEEIVRQEANKNYRMSFSEYHISELKKDEFINSFNLNALQEVKKIQYENNKEFSYLRLAFSTNQYFVIQKNDKLFLERIYNRIEPINEKGIIIGYTEFTKEYINSEGNIIWFEYLK